MYGVRRMMNFIEINSIQMESASVEAAIYDDVYRVSGYDSRITNRIAHQTVLTRAPIAHSSSLNSN